MTTSSTRDFDGSANYVDSGEVTSFNFTTQDFTAGAWVNVDTVTGPQTICGNRNGGSEGWQFNFQSNALRITKVGVSNVDSTTLSFSINTWYFVVAVVDMSTDVVFYVMTEDGTITTETVANTGTCNSSTGALRVGQSLNQGEFLNGQISHCQVWSGLLTASQIQEAAFKPGSIKRNLLGYWPLWGASTTEPDLGPSGFNGTVTGTDTAALDHPRSIIIKGA